MKAALLTDRGVLRVGGEPARGFLNNLVTSDIATLPPGQARYTALLTPQGKIVADFFVLACADDAFLIDCPLPLAAELVQKLTFYKLRAKVTIARDESLAILALWGEDAEAHGDLVFRDPRLPALGYRALIAPAGAAAAAALFDATAVEPADYEAHRIALGVPRGGLDFIYGDAFPHDADLDKLHGVDFKKGCFVGQEVVSRVEHRGTARNRIVPVLFEDFAAENGSAVMAGARQVGIMGSSAGREGLALLRVDRVAEALAAGEPLTAGGIPVRLRPGFADFVGGKASA